MHLQRQDALGAFGFSGGGPGFYALEWFPKGRLGPGN